MTLLTEIRAEMNKHDKASSQYRMLNTCEVMIAEYQTRIEEMNDEILEFQKEHFMMQTMLRKLSADFEVFTSCAKNSMKELIDYDYRESFKHLVQLYPQEFKDFIPKVKKNVKLEQS